MNLEFKYAKISVLKMFCERKYYTILASDLQLISSAKLTVDEIIKKRKLLTKMKKKVKQQKEKALTY